MDRCRLGMVLRCAGRRCRSETTFAKGLFQGVVESSQLYPFPDCGEKDERSRVDAAVAGLNSVLTDVTLKEMNKANDLSPEFLRSLGPDVIGHTLEGNTLSKSNQARIHEVIGEKDLGVAVAVQYHQLGFQALLSGSGSDSEHLPDLVSGKKIAAFCLSESGCGTDASSVKTTARLSEDGEHYIINGSKIWVSNGNIADCFTVFAQTEVGRAQRLSAFFVERSAGGITHGQRARTVGLDCCSSTEVFFKDVRVPKTALLGEAGSGYKLAMSLLSASQFKVSGALLGSQKSLLKHAVEHANTRKQFGRRLREMSLIKQRIALMSLRVYATESALYRLTSQMGESTDTAIESAVVKVFATESALGSIDDAMQILGAKAYSEGVVEQLLRDVNGLRNVGGTKEINSLFLALSGLEVAGQNLRSKSTTRVMLGRARRSLGMLEKSVGAHPSLKQSSVILDQMTSKMGATIENVLIKFGKKITDEQMVVSKVADAITLLYTMGAVISRASKAAAVSDSSSQHEIVMATTWVKHCTVRLNNLFTELEHVYKTLDSNFGRIADHVSEAGGYIPPHPCASEC